MSKWKILMMGLMVLALMTMPLLACSDNGGDEYDLTMAATGNGSTSPAAGVHTYDDGTVVDITATPDSGWEFDSWTGDVADPDSASTTVTMDEDKTVSAKFTEMASGYTLTIAVEGNGNTDPAAGTYTYAEGTVVDITASPSTSYSFNEWTGDVDTVDDVLSETTTITMDGDKSISAHFTLEKYPSITMTEPSTGDTVSGMVHVEATITDNKWVAMAGFTVDVLDAAAAVTITMDPAEGGQTVTASYDWDSTTVANGEHTLYVLARDNLNQGFVGPAVVVTVSNQPFAASIDSPSNGDEVSGMVTIEASASDDADIVSGEYSIDGGTAVAMTMDPAGGGMSVNFTADWDTTAVEDGDHTITLTVENTDAEVSNNSVTVRVNNEPDAWGYETTYEDPLLFGEGITPPEIRHWTLNDEGIEHIVTGLDPTSILGEEVGTGDGTTIDFDLDHTLVVLDTDTMAVGGTIKTRNVDYTIDLDDGVIHFTTAPANGEAIVANYTYYNGTWEGDCRLMDYVLPPATSGDYANGQILFKGSALAVLTIQSDYYDVATGRKMYTTGGILLFGLNSIVAYQSYEWTDDTHYIMYTLMVPNVGASLNEQHELVPAGTETVQTDAGNYVCNVIEDYLTATETGQDTGTWGDPLDVNKNPSPNPVLMRTEWRDSSSPSDGLIKFVISSYNTPMTAILESLEYSPS